MPITEVYRMESFSRDIKHVRDGSILEKLKKQIEKVKEDPDAGKPLRYDRKGERTIYVKPYRLIYSFEGEKLFLLRFVHRDHAYG